MRQSNLRRPAIAFFAAVIALSAVIVVGCRGPEMGSRDQITVVTHRHFDDDGVMRVVGLVRNTGELPAPESEIVVTLRSRTGSFQGQNRVALPRLEAGADEEFRLGVDSHGRVERIEFEIVEPGTVTEEGSDQAPGNAADEGDQDAS